MTRQAQRHKLGRPKHEKKRQEPARYAHLDALRALAVLLVVFSHAGLTFVPGGSGVTIFFVISGFIITHLLIRERETTGSFNLAGFYARRFLKILPPLILIIVIPSLVWWASGRPLDPLDFLGQIFFFFNLRYLDSQVTVLPGSNVVWSLSIEEQFYLFFALFWLLLLRVRNYRAWLIGLGWGLIIWSLVIRTVLHLGGASSDRIYFGTDTRLDAIVLGMLAAIYYQGIRQARNHRHNIHQENFWGGPWVPAASALLYLLTLIIRDDFFRDTIRYSLQAAAAGAFLLWGLTASKNPLNQKLLAALKNPALQKIGLASYSIYLVHQVIFKAIHHWLEPLPLAAQVAIQVPLALGIGLIIYQTLEVPIQDFKNKKCRHS